LAVLVHSADGSFELQAEVRFVGHFSLDIVDSFEHGRMSSVELFSDSLKGEICVFTGKKKCGVSGQDIFFLAASRGQFLTGEIIGITDEGNNLL
jgi:hypothetical protein